ncbi:MAG: hypothetical protein AAF434_17020 [Pseudomonadota bacterium]
MQLSINIENSFSDESANGPVTVGWVIDPNAKGNLIFYEPERVRTTDVQRSHAKSASRCPAVINTESRYFLIRSPYDIDIEFCRNKEGQARFKNRAGDKGSVRKNSIGKMINLVAEAEWRRKDTPMLQIGMPYIFIADEPVYMSQVPPFMHYSPKPWPGLLFCGRFPINIWPRHLNWGFEWCDPDKPLIINRGDPLFYLMFETMPQSRSVKLTEMEFTQDLAEYTNMIAGITNHVNQTFSLFEEAERRRPVSTLVVPRNRPNRCPVK